MVERGGHARLADEALAELPVAGALGRDYLERNRALEAGLESPVDNTHSAAPGHRLDAVARQLGAFHEGHTSVIAKRGAASAWYGLYARPAGRRSGGGRRRARDRTGAGKLEP